MMRVGEVKKGEGRSGICIVILIALLFRWTIGVGPHSGEGKAPMFGDYEAQRHWTEITYNLPISEWYSDTPDNNLTYWGLDYPPLTAYHSWLLGFIGSHVNESWVELGASRGEESYQHKIFARLSVLVADLLLYFPPVILLVTHFQKQKASSSDKALFVAVHLFYPGFLLIDNAHFQYNNISLGLFLWGVLGVLGGRELWGAVGFVLALNYKQMELYHSLPFFCVLLSSSLPPHHPFFKGVGRLLRLGVVVVGSFVLIWSPFLFLSPPQTALQVLKRVFPFDRGIYEDKVANIWCSLSILFKWKQILTQQNMMTLSSLSTLAAAAPSCALLLLKPRKHQFKLSLINVSLCFFLFSYQVHEKSILLVAVPVLLVLHEETLPAIWFLLVSVISMYPLFVKDETIYSFYGLTIAYYIWLHSTFGFGIFQATKKAREFKIFHLLFHASIGLGFALCISSLFIRPPEKLPDIFPLLISVYSCVHFVGFYLYFNYRQLFSFRAKDPKKQKMS